MIENAFCKKAEILSMLPELVENTFGIAQVRVVEQIKPILDIIIDDIKCFVEYPYVEKYFRDSFYTFFSKKHHLVDRNSFRLSFFKSSLEEDRFFEIKDSEIQESFLGFISLRPTKFKIIGHSFLSPLLLKNNNFVCCLSHKKVSILGRRLNIFGFPYCSQDNEAITCSEASIINLMDYFGNKYPEYSIVMPSQIGKILSKQSFKRQLPSPGINTENISYVLKKLGFGPIVYSRVSGNESDLYEEKEFKDILYMYIESGIPLIATLSSKNGYHAVLVIGRENIDKTINYKKGLFSSFGGKKKYNFSEAFNKLLIMNDNHPPYEIVDYSAPIFDKGVKSDYHLDSFIVPLYSKVYLEAFQFKIYFFMVIDSLEKYLKNDKFIEEKEEYIFRFFLTSSNSYKSYLAKSKGISKSFKLLTVNKSMPKFVWVGEIIKGNTISDVQSIESVILVDATESGLYGHLIFATNSKYLIMKNLDKEQELYKIYEFNEEKLYTFSNNLRGDHSQWQNL